MSLQQLRGWMYRRRRDKMEDYGISKEYRDGVDEFIRVAKSYPYKLDVDKIRCPCKKCKNLKFMTERDLTEHLYHFGFTPNYYQWTAQGEYNMPMGTSRNDPIEEEDHNDIPQAAFHDLVNDVFRRMQEKNKANRDKCDVIYIGGTANMTAHRRRLERLNEDSDALSVFRKTHTTRPGAAVDKTAQAIERFNEARTRYESSESDGTGSSRTPLPDSYQMWGDSQGGRKKGRVFGLGLEASSYDPDVSYSASQSQSQSTSQADRDELARLRQQVAEQAQQVAEQAEQLRVLPGLMDTVRRLEERVQAGVERDAPREPLDLSRATLEDFMTSPARPRRQ